MQRHEIEAALDKAKPLPFGVNKTLVVIGGTSGIGAATARNFARRGLASRIVVVGRDAQRGHDVVQQCTSYAPNGAKPYVNYIQKDVSWVVTCPYQLTPRTREEMSACAANIIACLGDEKIDFLVRFLRKRTDARLCARAFRGVEGWF